MHQPWSEEVLSWIPHQRWFAGKGLSVTDSRIFREVRIAPGVYILLVEVSYREKPERELYQVPVVVRDDAPNGSDNNYIGPVGDRHVFDGVGDRRGNAAIFGAMRLRVTGADFEGVSLEDLVELPPRPVTTEQSNSSIIFGNLYIMKVFRRLWPGRNPDLALNLELARAGNAHIARPLGWLTSRQGDAELTLALVQEFCEVAGQGWELATKSLNLAGAAQGDMDTDMDTGGGGFAEDAFRLGAATAQVHISLADRLTTGVLTEFGAAQVADRVVDSYRNLTPIAPRLENYEDTVLKLVDRFRKNCWNLKTQRIHNDLHLTQVLKTPRTWVLIDFEGEPNTPITRRNEFGSPLRDVACMLRSFDYAAYFTRYAALGGTDREESVDRWLTAVRSAFVDGYRNAGGDTSGSYLDALLLFELEKALFEIDYEYNNRPSWLHVATESTYRLLSRDIENA